MSEHYGAAELRKMDLRVDPLRGLAWYERKPSSLSLEELDAGLSPAGQPDHQRRVCRLQAERAVE
ncbi:MAG: hypothetical protein WBY44_09630 [Bryobacteraceae bacterium]